MALGPEELPQTFGFRQPFAMGPRGLLIPVNNLGSGSLLPLLAGLASHIAVHVAGRSFDDLPHQVNVVAWRSPEPVISI